MENQTKGKIYSRNQIDIATFIGGPLIAGYLISQNFKTFGDKVASKKTLIITFIATLLLICGFYFLPKIIASKIVYFIPIIIADYIFRTYQSKKNEEFSQKGYKIASSLGILGKCVISLVITLVLSFLIIRVLNIFLIKYNYTYYLKIYCDSYSSKNFVKNTKVYVPEVASCFIFNRLKNTGYTLQQVDQVLNLEFEYQKQNNSLPYDPLPFIRERQKLGISDNQITEILKVEEEYLKLIGAIENSSK